MKKIVLLTLAILLCGTVFAQENDPVNTYLDSPNPTAFSPAISSLYQSITAGENLTRSKIYSLYLMNVETRRLVDELMVTADSLPAGERFSLANVLMGMEMLDQAVVLYEGLNEAYPTWSCPWRHKGEAYYKLGEYEAAAGALQEAINTNENHQDAYLWMAFALNELGEYSSALENLERALSMESEEEGGEDSVIPQEQIEALHRELVERLSGATQ